MNSDEGTPELVLTLAAHGYRATLWSQAIRMLCKAVSVIILARLISPTEHGAFAMAASVTLVLVLFRDLGLGAVAVQVPELSEEQKTTLFHTHAIIGLALAATTIMFAPAAAAFYREPRVQPLLYAMSGSFVLIGLNAWPRILLARSLRIAALNRAETLAAAIGTLATIGAALAGAGAFSFVAFLIVSEAVILVAVWTGCGWRPRGRARWTSLRGFIRPGADLLGHNLLSYLLQQIDMLLMGRWFGAAALGLYSRPAQLLMLPNTHLSAPVTQVLHATLARLDPTHREFARHVGTTANLVAHLTLPLAAICAAAPDEVVRLLFGAAWPDAAPLLRWLAVSAAASYLTCTIYPLCVATGHTRRLAAMSAVGLLALATGVWLGHTHGPVGLAAAVAATNVMLLAPRLWWAVRETPVRLRDFAMAFLGPAASGLVLAAGMTLGRTLGAGAGWGGRLAIAGGTGLFAAALLAMIWPRLRREWLHVWRHRPSGAGIEAQILTATAQHEAKIGRGGAR